MLLPLIYLTMTQYSKNILGIKSWAEDDRPREKLMLKGKSNLSDAELLAILIGSGSREETAVGLSQRVLNSVENNLNELGRKNISDLTKFKGIGEAKAISIIAAMEIGRRRQLTNPLDRPQIQGSSDAWNIIAPLLMDLNHEEFWIILLNRANRVINKEKISSGGMAGTVVDAKIIFRKALENGPASGIILAHNHPS
ncbi:MAG: DNA repair protein RadC, partial [Saprospiraceae bacterium]